MAGLLTFDELTVQVISMARDQTPRASIELGVIQGFCLDVAADLSPELVPYLSSVNGLYPGVYVGFDPTGGSRQGAVEFRALKGMKPPAVFGLNQYFDVDGLIQFFAEGAFFRIILSTSLKRPASRRAGQRIT